MTMLRTIGPEVEHITDQLRETAEELDGDIVQKGDNQIIITPTGVKIRREKLDRS